MTGTFIEAAATGGEPDPHSDRAVCRSVGYGVRFTAQVWPGDTLDATATVTVTTEDGHGTVLDVDLVATSQDKVEILRGYGQARLPFDPSRT